MKTEFFSIDRRVTNCPWGMRYAPLQIKVAGDTLQIEQEIKASAAALSEVIQAQLDCAQSLITESLEAVTLWYGDYTHGVYILEIGGNVKIGCSENVPERLKALIGHQAIYGHGSKRFAASMPMSNYRQAENAMHKSFASRRLGGELFNISLEEACDGLEFVQPSRFYDSGVVGSERLKGLIRPLTDAEIDDIRESELIMKRIKRADDARITNPRLTLVA